MFTTSNQVVRKGLSGLRGRPMGCSGCGRPRLGRLRRRLGQDDGIDWGDFGIDSGTSSIFGGSSSLSPDLTSGLSLPGGVPGLDVPAYSGGFPDTSSGIIPVLGPTSDAANLQAMGISTAGMSSSQMSSLLSSIVKGTAGAVTGLTASGVFGQTPASSIISQQPAPSLSSYMPLLLLGGGGLLLVLALSGRRR